MSQNLIVAIDGPAGSGKSTSAKLVARKLGYLYIDTGAMYRAVTYASIRAGILNNPSAIVELAENADIKLEFTGGETKVSFNGEDFTKYIRTHEVNVNVSYVSAIEGVRKTLVEKQQKLGDTGTGIVMEGRDIGTAVFPNADIKIFLTAEIDQRAERRLKEYEEKGTAISLEEIKQNLAHRDNIDSTREVYPLKKTPESIEVDTSKVSIDEQVNLILNEVKKAAEKKGIVLRIH